jgi:hypothetical protein
MLPQQRDTNMNVRRVTAKVARSQSGVILCDRAPLAPNPVEFAK